jgi:hypothetical protein
LNSHIYGHMSLLGRGSTSCAINGCFCPSMEVSHLGRDSSSYAYNSAPLLDGSHETFVPFFNSDMSVMERPCQSFSTSPMASMSSSISATSAIAFFMSPTPPVLLTCAQQMPRVPNQIQQTRSNKKKNKATYGKSFVTDRESHTRTKNAPQNHRQKKELHAQK